MKEDFEELGIKFKQYTIPHTPFIFLIDTSSVMCEEAENGKTKKEIMEDALNLMLDALEHSNFLEEYEKSAIDICIMSYDEDVHILVDWTPLSDFQGNVELTIGDSSSLNNAFSAAIEKVREVSRQYAVQGITNRWPQIAFYTNASSIEDMTPSLELYLQKCVYHNSSHQEDSKYRIAFIATSPEANLDGLMPFSDKNGVEIIASRNYTEGVYESLVYFIRSCLFVVFAASDRIYFHDYDENELDHYPDLHRVRKEIMDADTIDNL